MSEEKRGKIARALLVTGHPLPTLNTLREDQSEAYDRAIARVRAGLGLGAPEPAQQPAPKTGEAAAGTTETGAAGDAPADAGQQGRRPDAGSAEPAGTGGSGR